MPISYYLSSKARADKNNQSSKGCTESDFRSQVDIAYTQVLFYGQP